MTYKTDATPTTLQYRSLMRQSRHYANYNFREYAKRRTKDAFHEHWREKDEQKVQELMQWGIKELQIMKVCAERCEVDLSASCTLEEYSKSDSRV